MNKVSEITEQEKQENIESAAQRFAELLVDYLDTVEFHKDKTGLNQQIIN